MKEWEQQGQPPEAPREEPHEAEQAATGEPEDEGMSRRKFLKILGIGAGMAATGELLKPQEGAATESPKMAFQIRDGKGVLVHFDARGNVERYEEVVDAAALGLQNAKDAELGNSPEVTAAARKLAELGRRCKEKGDVEACRSITLATVELSEAIRAAKTQSSPRSRR